MNALTQCGGLPVEFLEFSNACQLIDAAQLFSMVAATDVFAHVKCSKADTLSLVKISMVGQYGVQARIRIDRIRVFFTAQAL